MATNKWDVIAVIVQKAQNSDELDGYLKVLYQYETPQSLNDEVERERIKQNNKIILKDDKISVVNTDNKFKVEIDTNDHLNLLEKINKLENEQLDALTELAENEMLQNVLFRTLLAGVVSQKNIVRGNISNVNTIRIGDELHCDFHYYRIVKKEVIININI